MIVANKDYKTKQYLVCLEEKVFHLTPQFDDSTKKGIVESNLCECGAALSYFEYSTVITQDLRQMYTNGVPINSSPLSKFTIEIWQVKDNDDHKWQHIGNMTFDGVVWGRKYHTNPEDSMCSGVGHFTYTSRTEETVDGKVVDIPLKRHKYPQMELSRVLNKGYLDGRR